jgi:hypothetical protein
VDVSQISMPMRILLIGAAVFLAAWFTVLKPGGAEEEIPPVTPANTTQTTTGSASAAATATPTPDAGAGANTVVAATAIPADVYAKLPKDIGKALKAGKTVVLGVFTDRATAARPMADDDRYVRNALEKTNRYKGQVFAKNVGVEDLVDYAPLVNDLKVTQTPSVVVIDRNLKGTVLTGYVDRIAINQAIADARRDSIEPAIADAYLRSLNAVCAHYEMHFTRWSLPTVRGKRALKRSVQRWLKLARRQRAAVVKLSPPAKWKSLDARVLNVVDDQIEIADKALNAAAEGKVAATRKALLEQDFDELDALDRKLDAAGVTACVGNRRS